jgi:hypothetical protein
MHTLHLSMRMRTIPANPFSPGSPGTRSPSDCRRAKPLVKASDSITFDFWLFRFIAEERRIDKVLFDVHRLCTRIFWLRKKGRDKPRMKS